MPTVSEISVDDVITTDALARRPTREPDYAGQCQALVELTEVMATDPATVLQRLSDLALELTGAGSAGISIEEPENGVFRWHATSGAFGPHRWGTMPRSASPCGVVLDRSATVLMDTPERLFTDLRHAPFIHEALLVPFYRDGAPVGTVWVVSHDPARRFDAEDLRLVESLSQLAATAVATLQDITDRRQVEEALRQSEHHHRVLLAREQRRVSLLAQVAEASRAVNAVLSVDAIARVLADAAHRILGARLAIVTVDTSRDGDLGVRAVASSEGVRDPGPTPLAATVGRTDRPLRVGARDLVLQPGWEGAPPGGWLGVPLVGLGRTLGVLEVAGRDDGELGDEDESVLTQLAAVAGVGIENARLLDSLRDSESRFKLLADSAPVLIWQTDAAGVEFVNRAYLEFFGEPLEALKGMGWADFLHPDDAESFVSMYRAASAARRGYEVQARLRRHDGEHRWLLNVGYPHFRYDGAFLGFIGCSSDVTDIKRAAEALEDADRRKDEFLATLAHELRNPLAPVRTGLQVLKLSPTGPAADRARAMMERQLGHMVRLIDDLMDLSRVTRGLMQLRKERVALGSVLETALEASRPLIEAGRHALAVELPAGPVWLEADLTRLAQVISNLLNNAAKYTPDGGHIALVARAEGREAVIEVRDDGVGIPAELVPQVFEMFSQVNRSLHRAQSGLGIGLAIVRRLVELHGGRVEAESAGPGQGSTFRVRLPTADSGPGEAPEPSARFGSFHHRVLVVDDNVDGAESLAMLLQLAGHDTRTVHHGLAVLEAARTFRPDVVFLDIGLPGLDGYAVARQLRSDPDLRSVRLVALTGYGSDEDKRRAKEAGFDLHLTKPVDARAVDAILGSPGR